jgi:hypothetical protein
MTCGELSPCEVGHFGVGPENQLSLAERRPARDSRSITQCGIAVARIDARGSLGFGVRSTVRIARASGVRNSHGKRAGWLARCWATQFSTGSLRIFA